MSLCEVIDATTAADYLRRTGRIGSDEQVVVRELTGGVSNIVLLVQRSAGQPSFVLKQAREQLRVGEPWFCDMARIWREIDVLKVLESLLRDRPVVAGLNLDVPQLLFEDRPNYCYGMAAIATDVPTWKEVLLAGNASTQPATAAATLLALIHGRTWNNADVAARFADRSYFETLRIEPYYRHVQQGCPHLQQPFDNLIASLSENACSLVHGDFSPKNLLLSNDTLTLLDFEVGHYGDPAFDVGFFFTHLVLKWLWSNKQDKYAAVLRTAADAYRIALFPHIAADEASRLMQRSRRNLGGCLLARVAGKSRVEYLSPAQQTTARQWGEELLVTGNLPGDLTGCLDQF